MTPQERAAAIRLSVQRYRGPSEHDPCVKDLKVLLDALQQTRRAALLECRDEINKLVGKDSGNWNRAIVYAVDAIDRLAQEG